MHLGPAFAWTWWILHWPAVFTLFLLAIGIIYYYAPDVKQTWTWMAPGCLLATLLWIAISLAFRFYVTHFGSYNTTYGAIGGVIVALHWYYLSALALLVGAELNAEILHAWSMKVQHAGHSSAA
jgi:membrane protein